VAPSALGWLLCEERERANFALGEAVENSNSETP
jgi:hypothetical protein